MQVQRLENDTENSAVVRFDGAPWLLELRRIEARGSSGDWRSPAGEGLLVVLGGTHDLYAGGGSWLRRGLRPTAFDDARPVAVFLPPDTPYHTANGDGVVLVVAVRQPTLPEPDSGRDEMARKPLLPMAGSGKAFDPVSGAWKPTEAFLSSPEAILPRRVERVETPSGAVLEHVIGAEYKALGLCLDEARLAPDQCVAPAPPDTGRPDYPAELAVYVETEGRATIGGVEIHASDGPAVVRVDGAKAPRVKAVDGRAYALFVYAGAKGSS